MKSPTPKFHFHFTYTFAGSAIRSAIFTDTTELGAKKQLRKFVGRLGTSIKLDRTEPCAA